MMHCYRVENAGVSVDGEYIFPFLLEIMSFE